MTTTRRIRLRDERGQTMTEMAVVLPVLCLLLFGVIQFGILFNNYVTLTDATRAGARKAAVGRFGSDPAGAAETAVRSSARDLRQADLGVSVASSWAPGSDVTVTATYPYEIDLLGLVLANGQLSSTTTERVE
jgi:Flp pilus assembly protein TadG